MGAPVNLDLGLGLSSSDAFSTPQATFAGTVFNFGNAGDLGDDFSGFSQTASAVPTSSASGKGQAAAGGGYVDANPNQRTNPVVAAVNNPALMLGGALLLLLALGAYSLYKNQ